MTTDRSTYVTRKWKAIKEDGMPLWPERFSMEWLANKRAQLGGYEFSSEYLNEPIDVEARKFRPEWIQWYTKPDLEYKSGVLYFKEKPLRIYSGVDQAIEEREDKAVDESAAVVVGVTADMIIPVLHVWHDRVDFPKQVHMVRSISREWDVAVTGIEKAAYQAALAQQVLKEGWLSIEGLENTRPKYERISASSLFFEQARIFMRACTEDEPGQQWDELGLVRIFPDQVDLYTQLMQFPMGGHDDIADAMTNALQVAGRERGFAKWF